MGKAWPQFEWGRLDGWQYVGLAAVLLIPLLLPMLAMRAARALSLDLFTADDAGSALLVAAGYWVTLAIVALTMRRAGITFRRVGVGALELRHVVGGALIAVLGAGLFYVVMTCVGRMLGTTRMGGMDYRLHSTRTWAIVIFCWVVTVPVCGELLQRGYLMTVVAERTGSYWIAALAACLVSGLTVLPRVGLLGAITVGVWSALPALLFLWSRSVYPCIIMRMLDNVWAFIVLKILLGELMGTVSVS